ncbi:hypothetical protein OCS_02918 [Ophiocordyceps sinensis CO18]|uniref:Uncharacterized protein n=1 Tax=Ophiocordyceps sinensis (strain Co18 / CGMCC 3.14243) TaxID=911162 RepID=T5AFK9_OPHSC|nr:hypothetical protein OCS_02918 [Ophiocordyceps sinensis CO18]
MTIDGDKQTMMSFLRLVEVSQGHLQAELQRLQVITSTLEGVRIAFSFDLRLQRTKIPAVSPREILLWCAMNSQAVREEMVGNSRNHRELARFIGQTLPDRLVPASPSYVPHFMVQRAANKSVHFTDKFTPLGFRVHRLWRGRAAAQLQPCRGDSGVPEVLASAARTPAKGTRRLHPCKRPFRLEGCL